jgi:nicotinamide-nucleotide amidase
MGAGNLSKLLGAVCRKKRLTLAVAESCTGGMIGSAVTKTAGASDYFLGGVIASDDRIKRDVLKVPRAVLAKHGAVSRETAGAMARGARRLFRAGCAVAVTGIAGPGGGTKQKPVGLVYIAVAVKKSFSVFEYRFSGTRKQIREKTTVESLRRIIERV